MILLTIIEVHWKLLDWILALPDLCLIRLGTALLIFLKSIKDGDIARTALLLGFLQ